MNINNAIGCVERYLETVDTSNPARVFVDENIRYYCMGAEGVAEELLKVLKQIQWQHPMFILDSFSPVLDT